ncbi:DNA helicase UvrD [Candidatus Velamenicoccus archaeovorus]|uniref:DNA helicase UvrD n=1 Tax=Velamenicoccus archaeovorus TaxID=1930593 RepID=A0A410P6A9_VELA1|nr:endonuclease Q family protein [Candidatus Velamenicoccus archaeovorus]QAT17719.1 DNA helicase UvrD [Candidatus Velamenicoccus archaeovorus]
MEFVADFHVHSKYSRATSRDMDVEHIAQWAKLKGISLMGTGDFTHHLWLEELKTKLEPTGKGLLVHQGVHFVLSAEVSSIYSKGGRTYRIHNVILAPSFKSVDAINRVLSGVGNLSSDGRPILGLDAEDLARIVFEADENCILIPGHIWTPWFSLFGSMSGFDRIEDCFGKQTPRIFALETGLSSDPAMNWRLSALDRFSLVSNSDSHSPQKIGREANVFNCELDYQEIREALRTKDKKKFLYTIEFFPEEGKYHYDGHRLCGIRFSPEESRKNANKCPKCGKPLTIGVMNRIVQLADRKEGFVPDNAIPYKNLVPLDEIIADAKQMGKGSLAVEKEYRGMIQRFGTEFNILTKVPQEELDRGAHPRVAEGICRVRAGRVKVEPGYDGEYGKVSVFGDEGPVRKSEEQISLF